MDSRSNDRERRVREIAYPPRRMRASTAARYLDVSESTFLDRVGEGFYPPGMKEMGVRLWLRDDLDRLVDRQFGVVANDQDFAESIDPFVVRFKEAG